MKRRVFCVVLAAGQGRRMGRLKQLLLLGEGRTLIETTLSTAILCAADAHVVVVNQEVGSFLREVGYTEWEQVLNDAPGTPMLFSVILGLGRLHAQSRPDIDDGVMILLGDQPGVSLAALNTCRDRYLAETERANIVAAKYGKRRGHPTIFPWMLICEVMNWSPDRKLSELLADHADRVVEVAFDAGLAPIDVNTPEDYERLRTSRRDE